MEFYSKTYENIIFIGDFDVEISEPNLVSLCAIYNFKSLINKPAYYKNSDNRSCTDLILKIAQIIFKIHQLLRLDYRIFRNRF